MVQLLIQGVQTVMPAKQTDPRQSLTLKLIPQNIFQCRFNTALCYKKACDEDSGWLMAGWIRESLGRALAEQPLFAGRIKRDEENGGGSWCIVSNDSGVRLVEGRVDMNLAEFLDLKEKSEVESELVFWEDVLEHDPQFSPLFYVQVTNFTCGGYSIGISCSLVLADPFFLTNFLKKWANLHDNIVSNVAQIPTFYLPNLAKSGTSPTLLMGSKTSKNVAQSIIFKIPTKISNSDKNVYKDLAQLCINEAENVIGQKIRSKFCLFVKMDCEDVRIEVCAREEVLDKSLGIELSCGSMLDEVIKVDKICFNEGNQPGYGSCWINSLFGEGCVMIIGSDEDKSLGMKVVVAFN